MARMWRTIGLCAGFLWLAACESESAAAPLGPASPQGSSDVSQPPIAPSDLQLLGNIPIPPGAKLNPDQSVIVGSGENWLGRVSLDVGRDVTGAYNFFLTQYQQQGWTLQSAVRSKTSLLVFTRAGRSATIEFEPSKLVGGSLVTLTMAPMSTVR